MFFAINSIHLKQNFCCHGNSLYLHVGHIQYLSFPEYNLKSKKIKISQPTLATHIKQVALMFHLIFSVESDFSVVMEKVRIYGNEDV